MPTQRERDVSNGIDDADANKPVSEVGSIESGSNTSGFVVTNDRINGRPFVNGEYGVSGDAVIVLEGRYDTPNGLTDWREYDSVDTGQSDVENNGIIQAPWTSYAEVRVSTDTTGIDVEFIVSGAR